MKEHNLLLGKVIRPTSKREFVKFRRIEATKPLEYLCWDIKYVWVQGERRNYYLLSVIDVYSGKILDWLFQSSVRQIDLINLFRRINRSHELKGIILRNDNGSQFIAHSVRNRFGGPIFEKFRDQAGIHSRSHPGGELVY